LGRGESVARSIEPGDQTVEERLPPLGALAEELPSLDCAKAGPAANATTAIAEKSRVRFKEVLHLRNRLRPSWTTGMIENRELQPGFATRAILYNTGIRGSNRASSVLRKTFARRGRSSGAGCFTAMESGRIRSSAPATNTTFPSTQAHDRR